MSIISLSIEQLTSELLGMIEFYCESDRLGVVGYLFITLLGRAEFYLITFYGDSSGGAKGLKELLEVSIGY